MEVPESLCSGVVSCQCMYSLTRRTLLRLGGVALAGVLAGCNTLEQQFSTPPQLGKLSVINYDPRPHTVHVLLLDDGEPVYWDSKEVNPAEDGEHGGTHFTKLPTAPSNYVLQVRADSHPDSKWEHFDFSEYDASCISIKISVGDAEQTDAGDVSIWKSTNPYECEEERTASE